MRIKIKAAPHPVAWADSYGWDASLHILSGMASTGPVNDVKNKLVPNIVIINGAVSPAILAIDNTIPVRTPLIAVLTTINSIILHLGIPREWAPSLIEFGTILRVSSITRVTIGIIIIDSEKAPAITEKEPIERTINIYPTMPIIIEGNPVNTSLKNLTAKANLLLLFAYSDK